MSDITRPGHSTVSLIKKTIDDEEPPTRDPWLTVSTRLPDGAPAKVIAAVAITTVLTMFLVPTTPAALGVLCIGIVVLAAVFATTPELPTPAQLVTVAGIVALLSVAGWRSAEWLSVVCVATAMVATGVLLMGARTIRDAVFTLFAPIILSAGTIGWIRRGTSATYNSRSSIESVGTIVRVIAVTAVLLIVFGALFAGADATFEALVDDIVPDVGEFEVGPNVAFGVVVGMFTALGCYAGYSRPRLRARTPRAASDVWIWAVPTGTVLVLYVAFLITQIRAMFGGDEYIQKTAGLTYADYARSGFWQLFAVTALTIAVVSVAWHRADHRDPTGRVVARTILGGLCLSALAVVASALHRMDLYIDAFGATRLRVSVLAAELWMGAILLALIVAGAGLGTRQLVRTVGLLTIGGVLAFAVYNPDHRVAQTNVDRFERTGKIDEYYLSTLSPDATGALLQLPEGLHRCVLRGIASDVVGHDSIRDFNAGRSRARSELRSHPEVVRDTRAC